MFRFAIDPFEFEWNNSRTVNVFYDNYQTEIDVFSLNYGRDYTKAEVMAAALEWMEHENV